METAGYCAEPPREGPMAPTDRAMNQRPVDSHPAPETPFCSTDDQLRCYFVGVTAATNRLSAASRMPPAGDLLRVGLAAVEERMEEETADAIEEHVADLDRLPVVGDPPSAAKGPDASGP
jgi:hypothetical protein